MFTGRPRAALPRTVLLCGAAMLALLTAQKALGQTAAASSTIPSQPSGASADDGLRGGGFYLEADLLISDDATHTVTATGSVEARYKGRVVRADQLA